MSGKYHQIIDAKIGELMIKHDEDWVAVHKELSDWFGENTEILAGRDIEDWLAARAPKWTPEGGLVVEDNTVIQVSDTEAIFWKHATPEDKAAWMKRSQVV